ncbi:hypothetical protein MAE02_34440 [Microvirga aerophila]|uniref:Uncharacterized protein n=1 Tax=Microvirga aerophila TaxID=670291 RepID=A0A512BUV1_9HYPH|nr:hypothetical protein MAE02_34440 [Microvirga aerophila]
MFLCNRHVYAGKRKDILDVVDPAAADNRENAQRQLSTRASLLTSCEDSRDLIDQRKLAPFGASCDYPDCVRVPGWCGLFAG